jgi:hypothetical protein
MNLSSVFYLAAVILLLLVTFGAASTDVNLLAAGLACIAAGLLVGGTVDRRIG